MKTIIYLKFKNRFVSSNWQIKFVITVIIWVNLETMKNLFKLLRDNQFVYIEQGNLQAIVTGIEFYDNLKVYGRSLNYILEKNETDTTSNLDEYERRNNS